jgi:hypothetical protein
MHRFVTVIEDNPLEARLDTHPGETLYTSRDLKRDSNGRTRCGIGTN